MKVFYDYQIFDYQDFGVMSRYFADVISHLPADCQAMVGVMETHNAYLSSMGYPLSGTTYNAFLNYRNTSYKKHLFRLHYSRKFGMLGKWDHVRQLNRGFSISLLKQGDFDLAHLTYCHDSLLPYLGGKPYVVTVFDMTAETEACDADLLRARHHVISSAAGIITPDEKVRQTVISFYRVSPEKVFTVPPGIDPAPVKFAASSPIRAQYMVYVDNRRSQRLFGRLLEAISELTHAHPNLKLICLGPAFNKVEQALIEENRLSDTVVYINARSQKEVLNIYHHAEACITSDADAMSILRQYDVQCSGTPLLLCDGEASNGQRSMLRNLSSRAVLDIAPRDTVLQTTESTACLTRQQAAQRLAEVYQLILDCR